MIEISRTVTFGRYVDNRSPLTRMDPRAKILCAIALIATFSYISSFTALALCFLICVVLQILSRLSLGYVLRGVTFVLVFLAILYVFQVLFYASPTQETSIIWRWWFLTISREGLLHSAQISIRVLLLYYLTLMLLFSTSVVDLTDGSESLLSPLKKIGLPVNEFIMIFVIALKFVPLLIAEVERLSIAQATRGVYFNRGNPVRRVYRLGSLLVPLFISSFRRVETLTTAMEARGYRGGYRGWRRSKRREKRFTSADTLALIAILLFCVATILVNIFAHF